MAGQTPSRAAALSPAHAGVDRCTVTRVHMAPALPAHAGWTIAGSARASGLLLLPARVGLLTEAPRSITGRGASMAVTRGVAGLTMHL